MIEQTRYLLKLIKEESELYEDKSLQRIFLSGHSMGCKMVMSVLLRYNLPSPIGGVIGISGSIALTEKNMCHNTEIIRKIPCLILHGSLDRTTYWDDARISY
tara:strand:- start:97 stop:402 length:306 start_codon:yes stop_codon:yes gene_type:complete